MLPRKGTREETMDPSCILWWHVHGVYMREHERTRPVFTLETRHQRLPLSIISSCARTRGGLERCFSRLTRSSSARGRNFCVCSSMVMPEEEGGGWYGWNHFKDLGMGSWAAVHGTVRSWWIGKRYSKTWAIYLYLNWSIWTADIYVNSNFHELKKVKWRSVSLIIIICNLFWIQFMSFLHIVFF